MKNRINFKEHYQKTVNEYCDKKREQLYLAEKQKKENYLFDEICEILGQRRRDIIFRCFEIEDIENYFQFFHFNSIEYELIKYYFCYVDIEDKEERLRQLELSKAYLRISKFGILFNYNPNPFQILKAVILKYYCSFFIYNKIKEGA